MPPLPFVIDLEKVRSLALHSVQESKPYNGSGV